MPPPRCQGSSLIEVVLALAMTTSCSWAVVQAQRALGPLRDRSSGLRQAAQLGQDELEALRGATGCQPTRREDSGVDLQHDCTGPAHLLRLSWQDRKGRGLQQTLSSWSQPPPEGDD